MLQGSGAAVERLRRYRLTWPDYVRKVALYAYKTTDEDIQRLKEAGYSEDMIFEITLCASMGAGLARLERGLTILKGGR